MSDASKDRGWGPQPSQGSFAPGQSVVDWIKRIRVARAAIAIAVIIILVLIGNGIYNAVAPANDLLPSTPSGWTRLATISATQSSSSQVNLHGVQLQICWVVKGGSVASLSYEIGSPLAGSTVLYGQGGSQNSTGCLYDPGNDTGTEIFAVNESGIGSYAVSLNEQLTPSQESAINEQARQQAAQQSVDHAAKPVASDLNSTQSDTAALKSDLASVASALQREQKDLKKTQQASAAVVAGGNNSASGGFSCGNASNVQGDASNVQGDASNVQGSLSFIPNDVTSLKQDLSSLKSDRQNYQAVVGSESGYTSAYEPSSASIQSAEAAAQVQLTAASSINSSATTAANQMVSQANAAAQAANSAGC